MRQIRLINDKQSQHEHSGLGFRFRLLWILSNLYFQHLYFQLWSCVITRILSINKRICLSMCMLRLFGESRFVIGEENTDTLQSRIWKRLFFTEASPAREASSERLSLPVRARPPAGARLRADLYISPFTMRSGSEPLTVTRCGVLIVALWRAARRWDGGGSRGGSSAAASRRRGC